MSANTKIISFICAIYNSEQWIDKLIESMSINYAYEILFCDDCSTDSTLDKLIEWQKKIPCIKIITNEVNKGQSYSLNRLFEIAKGDYLTVFDSDDYYLPSIKEVCEIVITNKYDIVWYDLIGNDGRLYDARKDGVLWSGHLKIFKRSILGNARFGHEGYGDVDFTKELFKNAKSNYYTELIAYHYNNPRENSLHDRYVKGEFND